MKKLTPFKYALMASLVTHSLVFAMGKGSQIAVDNAPAGLVQQQGGAVALQGQAPQAVLDEVVNAPAAQQADQVDGNFAVGQNVDLAVQNQALQAGQGEVAGSSVKGTAANPPSDDEDGDASHASGSNSSDEDDDVSDEEGVPGKRKNADRVAAGENVKRLKVDGDAVADENQAPQTTGGNSNAALVAPQPPAPAAPQPSLLNQALASSSSFIAGVASTLFVWKMPKGNK